MAFKTKTHSCGYSLSCAIVFAEHCHKVEVRETGRKT